MNKTGKARKISILGSTGSIGRQALEVVSLHEDRLEVVALTANENIDLIEEQARRYRPEMVGLVSEAAAVELATRLAGSRINVVGGSECLELAATHPAADIVLNAIVGSAGLRPSIMALEAGKRLALANKESMVAGGDLVLAALARGGELIPVDSEHGAIFHCLRGEDAGEVERLILTASGGPFHGRTREQLACVTRAEALSHPTWNMGRKITIDSATLMNKGLEVIEAHFLFEMPYDRIAVVVHPQSVVHSLVEFVDGSLSAQLSLPDMRLPIALALSYPERWGPPFKKTSLEELGILTFGEVDTATFRCIQLAYRAGKEGGVAPAVLNAANEVAVAAFLEGRIGFAEIEAIIEKTLDGHEAGPVNSLEDVIRAEGWARAMAATYTEKVE
jgi:1-deoxy-D-xylulose-5-phosphate reductoisomerase